MTWDEISTKVLADCGRCCCLCRRFSPIRLQVHHIVPQGEGGADELDNAIALCLTCHTDVHTKAPFTRRFTVEELKMHRENVYRLVAEGKLPAGNLLGSMSDRIHVSIAETVSPSIRGSAFDLLPSAIQMLLAAAVSDGQILVASTLDGDAVQVGGRNLVVDPNNPRLVAECRQAVNQLEVRGLIVPRDWQREVFDLTLVGFALADEIQAEEGHIPEE